MGREEREGREGGARFCRRLGVTRSLPAGSRWSGSVVVFFVCFFFLAEVLKGKEASRRALRPGVSLSLPSPAENPPPIIWATAHTVGAATTTAAAAARSPSSQQTAASKSVSFGGSLK